MHYGYPPPKRRIFPTIGFAFFALLQGCGGVWSLRDSATPETQVATSVPPLQARPAETLRTPMLLSAQAAPPAVQSAPPLTAQLIIADRGQRPEALTIIPLGVGANPPEGFFLPTGLFNATGAVSPSSAIPQSSSAAPIKAVPLPAIATKPVVLPMVYLYASRTTRTYFAAGGVDPDIGTQAWEGFLAKYSIPFEWVTNVEQLEKLSTGVLVLPSSVALSDREKKAIAALRSKGGSILASWLTGVRNETGEWSGFGFMESTLGAKVVGTTEPDEEDTFLNPHGDSPLSHEVAAGQRLWLERVKAWYPLRLLGKHSAAQIMDWGRSTSLGKSTSVMVFEERLQAGAKPSRAAVLGFPERLWISADAQVLEPMLHNTLRWLLRQPSAYRAAWPYQHGSALVLAIDAADTMVEADISLGKWVADLGGVASYYVLTEQAAKSTDILKKIQANGHEVAYLGDRFEGFKEQSTNAQIKRLDTMLREMKGSGITLPPDTGFHPPMESYDKTTERLVRDRGFGYYIGGIEASEARLPFLAISGAAPTPDKPASTIVVLPRTTSDPEDLISEGDAAVGIKRFLLDLSINDQMGGLSIVRVSNRSSLTPAHMAEIGKHIKGQKGRLWLASATQVAQWWRERERVSVSIDTKIYPPLLTVNIVGDGSKQLGATAWVNLPDVGSVPRLVAIKGYAKSPKVTAIDTWRAAINLDGLTPGEYGWHLYFDPAPSKASK